MHGKLNRRWIRFSCRGLFVAVAVFSIWLGYTVDWVRQRRAAGWKHELVAAEANSVRGRVVMGGQTFVMAMPGPRPHAPWPLRWFGEPGFGQVLVGIREPAAERERIRELFPEATIVRKAQWRSKDD